MSAPSVSVPAKLRSSDGCWTCRLRRKKCDETRPGPCLACAALEIECHYDEKKPDWMDGGARQRAAAEELKATIKRLASARRDRKFLEGMRAEKEARESASLARAADAVRWAGDSGSDAPDATAADSYRLANVPSAAVASSSAGEMAMDDIDMGSHQQYHARASSVSGASSSGCPQDTPTESTTDVEPGGNFQMDTVMSTIDDISAPVPGMEQHQQQGHFPFNAMQPRPEYEPGHPAVSNSPECMSGNTAAAQIFPCSSMENITADVEQERGLNSVLIYLDYVFPYLFPFYRPPLFEGGRGWLLVLLMRNRALYHTALSMASYFFSVVLEAASDGKQSHERCRMTNWAELQRQQQLALRELQREIDTLNRKEQEACSEPRPVPTYRESARIVESILQLLIFDVAISSNGDGDAGNRWTMHLDAALGVYLGLMARHVQSSGHQPDDFRLPWYNILRELALPGQVLSDNEALGHGPWSSDQAAFRFFSAVLVVVDVVAATALGRSPQMAPLHHHLLRNERPHELLAGVLPQAPSSSTHQGQHHHHSPSHLPSPESPPSMASLAAPLRLPASNDPRIDLNHFAGVDNWVVTLVGAVATLDAWKKECRAKGCLDVVELVRRASHIEGLLRDGIARTEAELGTANICNNDANSLHGHDLDQHHVARAAAAVSVIPGDGTGAPYFTGTTAMSAGFAVTDSPPQSAPTIADALDPVSRLVTRVRTASAAAHTRVWARAALAYLGVVVHGWQPRLGAIRREVVAVRRMMEQAGKASPACLRTMVWPLAVVGCLAGCAGDDVDETGDGSRGKGESLTEGQARQLFRDLVESVGSLHVFSTLREALAVMEAVWRRRDDGTLDERVWDISECLGVLGYKSLLM